MEIDSRVEPLVRAVLNAVVKRDAERLQAALTAFPDADKMATGYRLAAAVALYVLHDQYGRQPTPDEIRAVADKTAELENWTDITSNEIRDFLTAIYAQNTTADAIMPLKRAVLVSYVLTGDLLSSCRRQDEKWWDYLDRAEAAIEAAPR